MNAFKQLVTDLLATVRLALRESTALRWAILWQLALLALSLLALPLDARHILGLNPWIKPMKFELSVIVYLLTLVLFFHALAQAATRDGAVQTDAWLRTRLWLGWGFAVAMTVENSIIALQSARGVRSHMNYTSLRDGLLFGAMGVFIAFNTFLVAWLLAVWCAARLPLPAATKCGVALGLLMLLLGSIEGAGMVQHGAHTVGAKDGLDGLPFLDWSRTHGDLRVAHFFALHALQIFSLAGVLFARTSWRARLQVTAVCAFAGIYTAAVWWLFAQAMHGRPLLAYESVLLLR